MGFEFFKSKSKSPEQKKMDDRNRAALGAAGALLAGAGAIGFENNQHDAAMESNLMGNLPASAPTSAENPTGGMNSSDAAPAVVVEKMDGEPKVIRLNEKPVVINLKEESTIVKHPEF